MPYTVLYLAYWFGILPIWTIPVELYHLHARLKGEVPVGKMVGYGTIAILATHIAIAAVVSVATVIGGLVTHDESSLWFLGLSQWDNKSSKAALGGAGLLFAASYVGTMIETRLLQRLVKVNSSDWARAVAISRRWSAIGRWGIVFAQIIFA